MEDVTKREISMSYWHEASNRPLAGSTIGQLLDEAAREVPDHVVFVVCDTKERIHFKKLWNMARGYAKGMLAIGLKKGDVMCMSGMTSADWVYLYFAASYIGVVVQAGPYFIPYDSEFFHRVTKSQCKLLVVGPQNDGEIFHEISKVLFNTGTDTYCANIQRIFCQTGAFSRDTKIKSKNIESLEVLQGIGENITDDALRDAADDVSMEDTLYLVTTSGSTGVPKLVGCIHRQVVNAGNFCLLFSERDLLGSRHLRDNEEAHVFASMNIWVSESATFFITGIGVTAKNNLRTVFLPGALRTNHCDPDEHMLKVLELERCVDAVLWPPYHLKMMNCSNLSKYNLSSLRGGVLTGQRVSSFLAKYLLQMFPKICNVYSLSECLFVTRMTNEDGTPEERFSHVGRAVDHLEIKLVDDNGHIVPVGEDGEICVRGWSVTPGYWNDPEKTAKVLRNGWFHTGDAGTMDCTGIVTFLGRRQDAIFLKRYLKVVYPGPTEHCMVKHPKVADAMVVSRPDDVIGDEMILCVTLNQGVQMTKEELLVYCKANLPELSVPDQVVFVDQFPIVGVRCKVSKQELLKKAEHILNSERS